MNFWTKDGTLRRCCIASVALLGIASSAHAADPDLARAAQLVHDGQYLQAHELLAPFETAAAGDASFDYLSGRAALGLRNFAEAKTWFERSLALKPQDVPARLGLGRAYFGLGMYAEAKIEFETVLRFDDLPQGLVSQVEVYDQAARQSLDQSSALTGFGYAETGIGRYRENDTRATRALGGGDRQDTFYNARAGGGFNYQLDNGYAVDGSLDYRFRHYDNSDVRNDSDLRWNLAGSRSLGEGNLAVGVRGRNSYRGNGDFRNDAALFTDYRLRLDPDDQLSVGAEVMRRQYPRGTLRDLSRTSATLSAGWVHSLLDGAGSLSLSGHAGQRFGTDRPDGNSDFFGATVALDFTINNKLGWGTFAWWERDAYNIERLHLNPDTLDTSLLLTRKDNLYEAGAYLVWEFAPSWTLRPELLWIRDHSNSLGINYSSTEFWLNIRKGF